jgi:hypothetical protein
MPVLDSSCARRSIPAQYMLATKAWHPLGDLSRQRPSLCLVTQEDDHHFYGHWAVRTVYFFNVQFPKLYTRGLTAEDKTRVLSQRQRQGLSEIVLELLHRS